MHVINDIYAAEHSGLQPSRWIEYFDSNFECARARVQYRTDSVDNALKLTPLQGVDFNNC